MSPLPLLIGPLAAEGFAIRRSGVHWLYETGHLCRPNEVIAYCNISLVPAGSGREAAHPFADEVELQIGFAPRIAGYLQIAAGRSPGGYLNHLGVERWHPGTILAYLDPVPDQAEAGWPDESTLRLLMIAGRRMTGLAEVHAGLLPGWHSRSRAWWCDGIDDAMPVLLSLGLCDVTGIVLGDRAAFVEIFAASARAAQIVFVPDHPVMPCAPILTEQFVRNPAQFEAIAADLRRGLADAAGTPVAADWMFAGALLSSLGPSPMRDDYTILAPSGLRRLGPAGTILLSLSAEQPAMLRHKKLGYAIQLQRRHHMMAGPAMRAWLADAFAPVARSFDDIRRDYVQLIDTVAPVTGSRFVILNRMSTSGHENIWSYQPFDHPMGETLANIASKELNLMLHDLAAERAISIVDLDAIAADLGGGEHLPDGMHQSGALQAELRAEILHILHRQAPGSGDVEFDQ